MINIEKTENTEYWINKFETELESMSKDTNKKYKLTIEELDPDDVKEDKIIIEIGGFDTTQRKIKVYDVDVNYKELENTYNNYTELINTLKYLRTKKGTNEKVVNLYKNSLFSNRETICTWVCDSCGNNAYYTEDKSYTSYLKSLISPTHILTKYNSVNSNICAFCDEYRFDKWHDVSISNHSFTILNNKKNKIGFWTYI